MDLAQLLKFWLNKQVTSMLRFNITPFDNSLCGEDLVLRSYWLTIGILKKMFYCVFKKACSNLYSHQNYV